MVAGDLYSGYQIKQEPQTAPPVRQRVPGSSAARYGSSSSGWSNQQQLQLQQGFWSPSRLLLSPDRPPRGDQQQLLHRRANNGKGRKELDEEETAGEPCLLILAKV
jgi:hypothetical protein